jgi:hypothetical protein
MLVLRVQKIKNEFIYIIEFHSFTQKFSFIK